MFFVMCATLFFTVNGFSSVLTVSPEIIAKGKVHVEKPFNWNRGDFEFTAYNQDVQVETNFYPQQSTGDILIRVPEGETGTFFLRYRDNFLEKSEKECEFTIIAKSSSNILIGVKPLADSSIDCMLSGNPNSDLLINIKFKPVTTKI